MSNTSITRDINVTQRRLLARALFLNWPFTITGFLTSAHFGCGSLIGVVWQHRKAGLNRDEFANGHLIVTSVIVGVRAYDKYWIFKTLNSYYVVIDFAEGSGPILEVVAELPRMETIH
ncbi:hypothetical protein ABZQ18_11510 [Pseudomonas aeruginosa]|uniref:hypothetical protein n=1 Tax=Pseudomonas aeruginosa TaxID=287 RepID=UPI00125E35CD|nr:hypothetical protein [Pseudomonas aeruginosa]ELK3486129.1 hypothetical protein [Pseudomonas aeruginosa]ELK3488803.1 hypothetical protein [Pseudomonas aeruginosa]EME9750184.1 hypothetical protein [Pseudomonas aeruginosa]HCF4599416.1 hypothetical protein [Pseudomonas aeruginosa]HCF4603602.1 hypothetical protein [Pseudomonas aeruginosa]